ncbi:hypothetical protein MNV49_006624 [Pseudohyphozyma bogoriensis]|nr:hypothetical protein MNV49_006624 [Pseudohyphozyma bogoriensis]
MSLSLLVHGAGLVVAYSGYGLLQERIIKGTYGSHAEHFESTSLLVLCNRVFAMALAVVILAWRNWRQQPSDRQSWLRSLRPTSPLQHFALVALYNFLATSCQYQALAHVSFTTASLAKTTKMVPVLLVGYFCYNKKSSTREWVAAAVIGLGCFTYLTTPHGTPSPLDDDDAFYDTVVGGFFLACYLFFDGLTSTSQEKFFGKSSSSTDPFGPESSVLPQMLFVNLFASIIALGGIAIDAYNGTFVPSVALLLENRQLQLDVLGLSATAAVGLVILLNTISSFGALTSAFLMTVRQFFSILLNAGIFRHVSAVGLSGWLGVGWVASGVYIKTASSWDEQDQQDAAKSSYVYQEVYDNEALLPDKLETASGRASMDTSYTRNSSPDRSPPLSPLPVYSPLPTILQSRQSISTFTSDLRRFVFLYGVPFVTPLIFVAGLRMLMPEIGVEIVRIEDQPPPETKYQSNGVNIEGGSWEKQLHDATFPQCNLTMPVRWEGSRRTALASNPRSGNTFTRELIERSSNYQTSTVGYCDQALAHTFHGECDQEANFLVKTHYPDHLDLDDKTYVSSQHHFDQVVHLVRNPIDSMLSGWHMAHVPKNADGTLDHSARLDVKNLGSTPSQQEDLMKRAQIWAHHDQYWGSTHLPTHLIRYEDLMNSRLTSLLSLLSFLLPPDELPSLQQVACAMEQDESREAYKSRKAPEFASWNDWDSEYRNKLIRGVLKEGWCRHGYDVLLRNKLGRDTGVDDNASNVNVFEPWTISAPDDSIRATFIALGATLQSLYVKDRDGNMIDVTLGYDDPLQYALDEHYPYFGAIVGRYANRIPSFAIPPTRNLAEASPPTVSHTTANEHGGANTLHGGKVGWSRAGWQLVEQTSSQLVFGLKDEGTEGFPGTVDTEVTYTVASGGVWTIEMSSQASEPTPIMLSHHSYWNLDGYKKKDTTILDHTLKITGDRYLETDGILIPTGEITTIKKGDPMDFSAAKVIGEDLDGTLGLCGIDCIGYDNCWIYDKHSKDEVVMELASQASGIKLSVRTDQPAAQVTSFFLPLFVGLEELKTVHTQMYACGGMAGDIPRKTSQGGPSGTYDKFSCVVLEQQGYIDGINHPEWGETQVYGPEGPNYSWWSEYTFSRF